MIHEQNLAPLRLVQLSTEPVPCRLGDLATCHDERVVNKHLLARLSVEDLVAQHHQDLVVNLSDVRVRAVRHAGGVELPLLGLKPKVQDVLGRQYEPHPHILAVLQRLVFVAG